MTNSEENARLDALYGSGTPASWDIRAHIGDPGDDGTANLVSGNGYVDKNVTNNTTNWPAASGGVKQLATQQEFAAASGGSWGRVCAVSLREGGAGAIRHTGWLIDPIKVAMANASDDVITAHAHGFTDGQAIRVFRIELLGTLPAGLTHGDRVFVRDVTTDTFKVAATQGGTAINITASGFLEVAADRSQQIDDGNVLRIQANQLSIQHV